MFNLTAFLIILFVVLAIFILIILRNYYLIKPYIKIASNIIKIIAIVKSFTQEIISALVKYLQRIHDEIYALFSFGNLSVVVVNNLSKCSVMDKCIAEKMPTLLASGNKYVVVSFGDGCETAIKIANLLAVEGKETYLLMIEPSCPGKMINDRVQVINILADAKDIPYYNGVDFVVNEIPLVRNLEGYIKSIENGVRLRV